jgi:hypothetical protein
MSTAINAAHYRLACDLRPLLPMIRRRIRFDADDLTLRELGDAVGSLLTLVDHYAPFGRRTAMGTRLHDALVSAQESLDYASDSIDADDVRGHLRDAREEMDAAERHVLQLRDPS